MIYDSVLYDDISFGTGPDEDGVVWCVSDIDGWEGTPPLIQTSLHPTGQDRDVITSTNLAGRSLVLRATGEAPRGTPPEAVRAAFDGLAGVSWPLISRKALTVTEGGVARTMGVILAGGIRKMWAGESAFIFEVPLFAEDPLKYRVDVSSQALPGTVAMLGNFPSLPVLTLTDGGDYTITNTTQGAGASWIITGAPAGTVVDMQARTVTQGGLDYYSLVDALSVWWTLLPGNNVITVTGGDVEINWRDAWL